MSPQDAVSDALSELKESLKALVEKDMGKHEREDMDALVDAFFKHEVFTRDISEIQKEFSSLENVIRHFQKYLEGRKWENT